MKRLGVFAIVLTAALVAFSGCDLITEYVTETENNYYNIATATESKIWNYSSSADPIYEVDSDVLSVTINNIPAGKTLYMVKHNTGSQNITLNDTRTIVSSSARSAANTLQSVDISAESLPARKHFVGQALPQLKGISARVALSAPRYDTAVRAYTTNDQKQIYVDTDYSMNTYEKKWATLYAIGNYCYVWIVNDYYARTASGNKVNASIAQAYADAFDKMYPVITHVFGKESNQIIDYDAQELVAITEKSDTGEKINIVIYDIGADYTSRTQTGVVGYFYAKDYYYSGRTRSDIVGKSNCGKYFYIDSGYANSNFDDTISTLAHEFQHMVNFNQKDIEHDVYPGASYNEMLSMLCEDMMQEFLGLEDYASPKSRIQYFNAYYSLSGITEYRNDNYAVLSYSTAYAFGSWLCRQYGGAALVKAMMENDTVDNDSIVAAVNEVNGKSYTFAQLFKQFLLALTKSSTYTHNQDAVQTVTYSGTPSYTYPMKKFDLWWDGSTNYTSDGEQKTYTFKLEDTDFVKEYKNSVYSNYDWCGPLLYNQNTGPSSLRAANGISIHGIEKTTAGSKTYTFSTQGADTLKIYLIIQ